MQQIPIDPVARARDERKANKSKLVGSAMFGSDLKLISKLITKPKQNDPVSKAILKTEKFTKSNLDQSKKIVRNTERLLNSYGGLLKAQSSIFKITKDLLTQAKGTSKKQVDIDKKITEGKKQSDAERYETDDSPIVREQKITNDFLETIVKSDKKNKKIKEGGGGGILGGMMGGIGSILSGLLSNPLVLGGLAALAAPLIGSLLKPWLEKSALANSIWDMLPAGLKTGLKMLFDPIGAIVKAFDWYKDAFTKNIFDPIAKAIGGFTDEIGKFFKDPIGFMKNAIFTTSEAPPIKTESSVTPPTEEEKSAWSKQFGMTPEQAGNTISRIKSGKSIPILTEDQVSKISKKSVVEKINQYNDIIDEAIKANPTVPKNLLKGLIAQESGGNPLATSYKYDPKTGKYILDEQGNKIPIAKGLGQFTADTAKDYGINDPYDPKQSIFGSAKYLAHLLDSTGGDQTKALAAYNAGLGALRPSKDVGAEGMSVWENPANIGYAETRGYVPNVLGKSKWFDESTPIVPIPTVDENANLSATNQAIKQQQQQMSGYNSSTFLLQSMDSKLSEWLNMAKAQTNAIKDNKIQPGPSIMVANPVR